MTFETIIRGLGADVRPARRVTLSEWAEEHIILSREYASRPGPLRLLGWQRAIFDSFTDPSVEEIVLMCGTQLIKTLFIQAALAYCVSAKPGPTLVVQPNETDAQTFSRERLAPMFRDCAALRGKLADTKYRDSSNTILYKEFVGGTLALVGAQAPSNLARRSILYLFCDEVDKYPPSAGAEGDPILLGRERTVTFGSRRKIILACSPTIHGRSRIEGAYLESDQQKPFVPCWRCGEFQVLTWDGVHWDNKLPTIEAKSATAHYECRKCGVNWDDVRRWQACDAARWEPSAAFSGKRGFWISHLYSPWKKLSTLVADFLTTNKSGHAFQVFVNTSLAETWKEKGETPDWQRLYDRREDYPIGIVPEGALLLTAAVDVQADRLEFEVKAWGPGRENWSVYYEVIQPTRFDSNNQPVICRTSEPEPWRRLAELIQQEWPTSGGGSMQIMAAAIDTGFSAEIVYSFCRRYPQPAHGPSGSRVHSYRTVFPIKGGHSGFKLLETVSDTDAARKRGGLKIVTIGSPAAKQEIYDALRLPAPVDEQPFPPGYYHFPNYESGYFQGLCAETRLVKSNGQIEWRKDGRNEPLDISCYNRAAAALCGVDRFSKSEWDELARRRKESEQPPPELPQGPTTPSRGRAPRPVRFRMGA